MKIVISGVKGVGKTTISKCISKQIGLKLIEIDSLVEKIYKKKYNKQFTFREIYKLHGEDYFRKLEEKAVRIACKHDWVIISTGGSTMKNPIIRALLRKNSIIIYLTNHLELIFKQIEKNGLPQFLEGNDPIEKLKLRLDALNEIMLYYADIVFHCGVRPPDQIAKKLKKEIQNYILTYSQSPNTFGDLIRITTFGESHGKAIGVVMDGIKPGIEITEAEIQKELDRRRPGQSNVSTPRDEKDQVQFISGVFEGKTTGTPICMLVYNKDQDSSKYENIKDLFRPGHADFTFYKKYGIRDYRGGGRSSGRETIARTASGAIAKKILATYDIKIYAYSIEIAGIRANKTDYNVIEQNKVRCADQEIALQMEDTIIKTKENFDSVGGIIQIDILGVPAGLGDPVFCKLDARLSQALMSLGAVKGIEFGLGFELTKLKGSTANDPMDKNGFLTNNSGGILGGISNGEPINIKLAIKPTSSILKDQKTVNKYGEEVKISVEGRHDPCIVPRIIPVAESMVALVILDALMIQKRIKNLE